MGIVTKPFQFEGSRRMKLAEQGIENLYSAVDTMITIPNQNLFRVATEQTTMSDAFSMADEVLHSGVRGVTDLMVVPGLINLDFNDVRTVMDEMGKAMMGTGEATGDRRAIEAAEAAINNPLLDDVSLKGAKGVLINITGGRDLTLYEVDEAASLIRGQVDEDANIIVGSALDNDLDGIVRVSVVATGVNTEYVMETTPIPTRYVEEVTAEDAYEEDEFAIEDEYEEEVAYAPQPAAPQPAPQPVPQQAPAYVAPKPYPPKIQAPQPAPQPQPQYVPQPAPAPERQLKNVVKKPFGFFGLKKQKPAPAPVVKRQAPQQSGDLFGDNMDEELEIPSFLRRQNR